MRHSGYWQGSTGCCVTRNRILFRDKLAEVIGKVIKQDCEYNYMNTLLKQQKHFKVYNTSNFPEFYYSQYR